MEYFSVGQATKGINVKYKNVKFFVKIPMINVHLLYEYFVGWSVGQDTKGINVKI